MLITFEALKDFAESTAMVALLAIAYGTLHRWFAQKDLADLVLGLLFGLGAVFAMSDPVRLYPGVIVDLRSVPVALAAVYLRPKGAVAALAIAVAMRLHLGGIGMVSGVVGLFLTFGTTLFLGRMTARDGGRRFVHLIALALACSASLGGLLFLPREIAMSYLIQISPVLTLCNAAGFFVLAKIIEREQWLLRREFELLDASVTDPLTRLLNRRGFEAAYARAVQDRRTGNGAALLLLDMDHFKALNDTHGHDIGDRVLCEVAQRIRAAVRPRDLVGRIGGEEMVVQMTGLSRAQAQEAALHICRDIARHPVDSPTGDPVRVTASIGVHWSAKLPDLAEALSSADKALYAAKRAGRDRFAMAV